MVQQAPQPKPKSTPNGAPSFFSHYYSPSLSLFPLSFPNKTTAAGSAACRTMPPAQSHPTIPGLSWDIYDTSHSCHVNPPGEGGPKSSCQGAGRIPLWKRTSLSDTQGASGISGSPPLLRLFLGLEEEQGKARISMGWWGWFLFFLWLQCQVVIFLQEFWGWQGWIQLSWRFFPAYKILGFQVHHSLFPLSTQEAAPLHLHLALRNLPPPYHCSQDFQDQRGILHQELE